MRYRRRNRGNLRHRFDQAESGPDPPGTQRRESQLRQARIQPPPASHCRQRGDALRRRRHGAHEQL